MLVMDKTAFDTLIQAKWNSMKSAMTAGDIEAAVAQFTYSQQETFRQIFNLHSGKLAQIAAEMQDIEFIHSKNGTAEYRIRRTLMHNGESKQITFYIYFDRENDGIWRIRDF